ncbi:MAG: hypothetical protein QM541_02045 [Flavobacterium sp.]|nr:hypothetical protein [Flavobacterium sp.]
MKKVTALMAIFMALAIATFAAPNEKVLKAFGSAFPNIAKVEWGGTTEQPTAYFKMNNIQTRVSFNKDGNFLSLMRYYTEKELPTNIVFALQKKHADKKVTGVTETSDAEGNTNYYIKMQDGKHWWTLKTTNGVSFEVYEKYKLQA